MAEHIGDDVGQSVQKAAQTGVKAARATKTVAKAAGMAATGNYAGAAVETLKSEETRKLIAILLAFCIFSIYCVVFLVPTLIFETLASLGKEFSDSFSYYYSETNGKFIGVAKATMQSTLEVAGHKITGIFGFARNLFSSIAKWFNAKARALFHGTLIGKATTKWFHGAAKALQEVGDVMHIMPEGTSTKDENYDDDRDIIAEASQTARTYKRKLQIAQNVVMKREKDLAYDIMVESSFAQATNRSGSAEFNKTGKGTAKKGSDIDEIFRKQVFPAQFPQGPVEWPARSDPNYENDIPWPVGLTAYKQYYFDKVDVLIRKKTIKPQECLKLIALYELLSTDTENDITPAGFSRWVGLYDGTVYEELNEYSTTTDQSIDYAKTVWVDYDVGESTAPTRTGFKGQKGGFTPKYLVIEEIDVKYEFDDMPEGTNFVIAFIKQIIKNKTNREKYNLCKVAPVDLLLFIDSPDPFKCPGIPREAGSSGVTVASYGEFTFEQLWEYSSRGWSRPISNRYCIGEGHLSGMSVNNVFNLELLNSDKTPYLMVLGTVVSAIQSDGPIGSSSGWYSPSSYYDYRGYPSSAPYYEEEEEEETIWTDYEYTYETHPNQYQIIYYFAVRYEYPVTIDVRSVDKLVELAAFFEGSAWSNGSSSLTDSQGR